MMYRSFLSFVFVLIIGLLLPWISYASFIETTIGTAVVNDATAAYYNPAALMLLKNTQIIPLGTVSRFRTKFIGQSTTVPANVTTSGVSNSISNYYSPSLVRRRNCKALDPCVFFGLNGDSLRGLMMHDFLFTLANPVGLIGVALILVAYFFLSTGRWNSHSMKFQLANFIGAWMILYSLYFYWNLSSVIIELAWIAISMMAMVRIRRKNKSTLIS